MSNVVEEPCLVVRKFLARPQHEGVGAIVRRSIGRFELKYFDPFLVLDEFSVSAPAGFPDHPHRGLNLIIDLLFVFLFSFLFLFLVEKRLLMLCFSYFTGFETVIYMLQGHI
ncbi:pirin-like protein At1g50590 [Camellia sinensis]|uniref:pirin-like protein At1g50590 n=1 Tax=Camellia sinensis TaxID=4442 RepID=UPI001035FEC1|nr:pirin-like protein At1g50590 [Camellia sinensis]